MTIPTSSDPLQKPKDPMVLCTLTMYNCHKQEKLMAHVPKLVWSTLIEISGVHVECILHVEGKENNIIWTLLRVDKNCSNGARR